MRALFIWVFKVVTQTFIIINICDPVCENQGIVLEHSDDIETIV